MTQPSETSLSEMLQKPRKTLEDAQYIFESIRSFKFFENFFAQNLKAVDSTNVLNLCQGFQYEKIPMGEYVFQKGDASNNKFYVIISGRVGIIIPGRRDAISGAAKIVQQRTEQAPKGAKTIKFAPEVEQSPPTNSTNSRNSPSAAANIRTNQKKLTYKSTFGPLSFMYAKTEQSSEAQTAEPLETCPVVIGQGPAKQVLEDLLVTEEEEEEGDAIKDSAPDLNDDQKFEEYAQTVGRALRTLEGGEGFGELALKHNTARTASVVCRTTCEFLVITKMQFDQLFLKKEREKDNFLQEALPFLQQPMISPVSFNYILCSFKTEVFGRGNYLTVEGKTENIKDPKIFVISQGECVIEKKYSFKHDPSQPKDPQAPSLHIAVVGRGMMIGEEILVNEDSYDFSVRVISDNLITHSVSRVDYLSPAFKFFHTDIIEMFDKKKKQRSLIFENVKREHEAKLKRGKNFNEVGFNSIRIKHMISKPAIQSLNKQVQRTTNLGKQNETESEQFSHSSPKLDKKPAIRSSEVQPKKDPKAEFSSRVPQYVRDHRDHDYGEFPQAQAEPVKFFALEDLKGVKLRKNKPSSEFPSQETFGNYTVREHVDNTLRTLNKGLRKSKGFEEDLIEIRQIEMGSITDEKRMQSPIYDVRETSSAWKSSYQSLPDKAIVPVRRGMKSSTWMESPQTTTARTSYMHYDDSSQKRLSAIVEDPLGTRVKIPSINKIKQSIQHRDGEKSGQSSPKEFENSPSNKIEGFSVGLPKSIIEDDEIVMSKTDREIRQMSRAQHFSESPKLSFPLGTKSFGKKSQQTMQVLNTQKWRKQIFKKIPKASDFNKLEKDSQAKQLTAIKTPRF